MNLPKEDKGIHHTRLDAGDVHFCDCITLGKTSSAAFSRVSGIIRHVTYNAMQMLVGRAVVSPKFKEQLFRDFGPLDSTILGDIQVFTAGEGGLDAEDIVAVQQARTLARQEKALDVSLVVFASSVEAYLKARYPLQAAEPGSVFETIRARFPKTR